MRELQDDHGALLLFHETLMISRANEQSEDIRSYKTPNLQKFINDRIKNPDSIHKFMAYALRMYNKYSIRNEAKENQSVAEVKTLNELFLQTFAHEKTEGVAKSQEVNLQEKRITKLKQSAELDLSKETIIALKNMLDDQENNTTKNTDLKSELLFFFKRINLYSDNTKQASS